MDFSARRSRVFNGRRLRVVVATFVVAAAAGGGLAVQHASPAEALVGLRTARWPVSADGYTYVPVCIVTGSNDNETGPVVTDPTPSFNVLLSRARGALSSTWENYTSLRFTGWQLCDTLSSSQKDEAVQLYIAPEEGNSSKVGVGAKGKNTTNSGSPCYPDRFCTIHLAAWARNATGNRCIYYSASRVVDYYSFDCVEQYTTHEFGHAIGLLHEWQNPSTPSSCSSTRKDSNGNLSEQPITGSLTNYEIPNPTSFDWDSIMTYDDTCAHVDGVRFGSPTPDAIDQQGVSAMYAPRTPDQYAVGVIPNSAASCPDPNKVIVRLDNEDHNNANSRNGWFGAIDSGSNTEFTFCRVPDGARFGTLAAPSSGVNDYSVLKLGTSCPPGSTDWSRTQDTEDPGAVNEDYMYGQTGPTALATHGSSVTLNFCVFPHSASPTATGMPDLGYGYNVIANPAFRQSTGRTGWVQQDDEDDDPQGNALNVPPGVLAAVVQMGGFDRNTTYDFAEVQPTVSRPVNDDFPGTQLTGTGGTVSASNAQANKQQYEPTPVTTGGSSVWYRYTASASGPVSFDTCGSAFDTVLGVYKGTGFANADGSPGLSEVVHNDDSSFCGSASRQSSVSLNGVAATTYYVEVDGYNSGGVGAARGAVTLHWSAPGVPPAPDVPGTQSGNGWVSVNWNPPASNGGSAITSYVVTSSPGGQTTTVPGDATRAVLTVPNGVTQTVTVQAVNGYGTGPPSRSSLTFTPTASTLSLLVSYNDGDNTRLVKNATYFGQNTIDAQRTSVGILAYITGIVHASTITPVLLTGNSAPNQYVVSWSAADQGALVAVMRQYALTPVETEHFSVALVGYLLALGGN